VVTPVLLLNAFAPVATVTLADQVADRIVDAIAARRISSGDRLIETDLAQALQVSRVPVREALRILESQGLIVPSPSRGLQVASFDASWARQLHDVRSAIERFCARAAAKRLRNEPELCAQLQDRIATIKAAAGDWIRVNRADIAFHSAIVDIAESPLMATLWTAIARHAFIMFSVETYRDPDLSRVIAEHHTYLAALKHGNDVQIDAEVGRHIAGLIEFNWSESDRTTGRITYDALSPLYT
jgi:DNA-binding GntR family transcriptional regulator